jgi:nitrite reductase/ring-hydroxylating ferredoxin subunit
MGQRLAIVQPLIGMLDVRRVKAPPKTVLPVYQTAEYRIWREAVIARAGGRCEAVDNGKRCWKAQPRNRMFADHKVEIRDGGALFDPANGECLCGAHHSAKTAAARADRRTA